MTEAGASVAETGASAGGTGVAGGTGAAGEVGASVGGAAGCVLPEPLTEDAPAVVPPVGAAVLGTFWAVHLGDTLCTSPLPGLLREKLGVPVYVQDHPMLRAVFAHNPHVSGFAERATVPLDRRVAGCGHIIQRLQQGLGLAVQSVPRPRLWLNDEERAWAAAEREAWPAGRPACVLSTSALTDAGNLARVDWAAVGRVLGERYTLVQAALAEPAVPGARLYHGLSARRYAALVSAADLFVGGTSGGSHVAAAVGTPALVVAWRALLSPLRFPVSGQGVTAAFLYPQHWFIAAEDLANEAAGGALRERHLREMLEEIARRGRLGRPVALGNHPRCRRGFAPAPPRPTANLRNRLVRLPAEADGDSLLTPGSLDPGVRSIYHPAALPKRPAPHPDPRPRRRLRPSPAPPAARPTRTP